MSTTFTTPDRKNVNLAFTSGSSTSLTSSLERGVTTLQVNRPEGLSASGPDDAVTLASILADAEVAFQADGQGFTNGGNITSWTNNGTLGTEYNVSNTIGGQYPTFDTDDADNPFTTGALLFKDSNTSIDTAQFLSFTGVDTPTDPVSPVTGETNQAAYDATYNSNYESGTGSFTIYQVFSYETGFTALVPPAVTSNLMSNLIPSNPGFQSGANTFNANMYRPAIQFEGNDLNIYDRDNSSQTGISLDYEEEGLDVTASAGVAFIQVIYRDSVGDIYVFDKNGVQIGYEAVGSNNEAGFKLQFGAFGRVGNLVAYSLIKPAANKGSYIAAFGVINKDITKIKAQNLGRLLGEKYLP